MLVLSTVIYDPSNNMFKLKQDLTGVFGVLIAVSDGLELRPKYSGILHCMKSVWQQEGLRGLYQGVTPNVWGAGASWGLYFFLYVIDKLYTFWIMPAS